MEIPRIPQASSVVISSGNIINWECLKARNFGKSIAQSTTEEVKDCLENVLTSSQKKINWEKERLRKSLEYSYPRHCSGALPLGDQNREDLKVTVKAMMSNTDPEVMADAIQRVLSELETDKIDVLLLAVSPTPNAIATESTMDHLKNLWSVLERLVDQGQVTSLGVCDLEKADLEELYNFARIKPSIDQVNEISCCIIPPDLNAFSKEKKIQLLTHGDAPEILPAEGFQDVMKKSFSEPDAEGWHPSWVLRYTALIRRRGVITLKGYLVRAQRNVDLI